MELSQAISLTTRAVENAIKQHPNKFYDYHQGYAIIKEELDELWDAIKDKNSTQNDILTEALHVAATTLRFITDLTQPLC